MSRNAHAPELGGVNTLLAKLNRAVQQQGQHILLSGPGGAGKSALIARLAADLNRPLLVQEASQVGYGEGVLENLFAEAMEFTDQNEDTGGVGAIIHLKEVETLGGRKRLHLVQGISSLCSLLEKHKPRVSNVTLIATTSKPQAVDTALRRPGRLGQEFFIKVPTELERAAMLECLAREYQLDVQSETLVRIAASTRAYLATDLALLVRRILMSSKDWASIEKCLEITVPSGLRQGIGWVNLQKISWDSIGGLVEIKQKLTRAIEWPLRRVEEFKKLGIRASKGVLLYGPPGCGKTRLVRAAASNVGATLLSVSGAEIFSPFVGDSEKAIVELFRQARLGAPTILFIDEIDTLVSSRDTDGSKTSNSDKVLSALLTEMDGMGGKEQDGLGSGQVLVVGATNRPGSLDSALTRPGRLDTLIYVPPPDIDTRLQILETYLKPVPSEDLDLHQLAERTDKFSGADLENLIKESVLHLLTKEGMDAKCLRMEHIAETLDTYRPTLASSDQYILPY